MQKRINLQLKSRRHAVPIAIGIFSIPQNVYANQVGYLPVAHLFRVYLHKGFRPTSNRDGATR
jgi:hypothetical protein